MSNQYLIGIHYFLSEQIIKCQKERSKAQASSNLEDLHFYEGCLKELQALKKIISENYNLKTQRYS